jgi:hypothetical protein
MTVEAANLCTCKEDGDMEASLAVTHSMHLTEDGPNTNMEEVRQGYHKVPEEKLQEGMQYPAIPEEPPQQVLDIVGNAVLGEIRLSPEATRHLLKFLPEAEKKSFLLTYPMADIPGSPQHLVDLSTIDYSNYSANTKTGVAQDTI